MNILCAVFLVKNNERTYKDTLFLNTNSLPLKLKHRFDKIPNTYGISIKRKTEQKIINEHIGTIPIPCNIEKIIGLELHE